MNAKQELLEHINNREVIWIQIVGKRNYFNETSIEGTLAQVLPQLDFTYHSGYGTQHLDGIIWFADGTWSTRGEYDGSEWWEHHERPLLPLQAMVSINDESNCKK